jgi:DNA-directed RNA polymerase II subunit RPB2
MDNSKVWQIINKYFEDNPQCLVTHHIESYNDFFKNGIFQIFKEKNPVRIATHFDKDLNEYKNECLMYFGGKEGNRIYFGKPIIYDDNSSHYMYPNEARLRNMTYGMTVHYDIEIEFIRILEPGQTPNIVGLENEFMGGDPKDDLPLENIKLKSGDDNGIKEQNGGDDEEKEIMEGGSGKPPPRRRQKKKIDIEMTPAETALFRENIEKSMVTPNKQVETAVLNKIFLGKFPIMLQSNYCVLSGLPREVRQTMGECRNDVGGYFIIDGKEKTIVSQEKFGDNMLYIRELNDDKYLYSAEIRSVSENVSKPIRTLSVKIMAPTSSYTFKNIVVNIPNVRKPVPLFIVFRALGFLSDKEIITMCLLNLEKYESMVDLFVPSVHDAGNIMTQTTALKYIATLTKGKTVSHALEILADYFLPHVGEINFTQKAYYLGYIVFRLLSVYSGLEQPTDRDNMKFKRIELVGALMYDLFREYYTLQQRQIHLAFEEKITYNRSIYEDNLKGLIKENLKEVFQERSVEAGFKKALKGNWGSQTHTKRVGIVQDLNRLSHNSMMSHLRKTNLPMDASVKLVGPRVLHGTQWGFFDPIDTPDGGNIGLHKHMAISAYVTQGYSREPMISWLREKVNMKLLEECSPIILSAMTKVIVNGLWAGAITDPLATVDKLKLFRRNALIPIYTSVTFDIKLNTIFIYTDAGRICRPIFYRDTETNKMSYENKLIQKYLENDDFSWSKLISGFNDKKDKKFNTNLYKMYELNELYEGITEESNPAKLKRFLEEKAIIDYIDASETENALIAMNLDEVNGEQNKINTHLEIHESLIFGMMCNLINFPENNPATRNSFSCGQSKQACSLYHTNYQVRMDKTAVVLSYGQTPLVKTRYMEHINHEENSYGENALVAIMCYTGYNVEDAILINEGSLKRGLFRTTYYSTYEAHEEKSKSNDSSTVHAFTNIENDDMVVGTKPGYDYSKLDKYGLIRENTIVDDKTVLIGIASTGSGQKGIKTDMSKVPKKGQLGIVDKAFITDGDEGYRIAKIRVRETRIPNIGDKMASRAGQKGTIGLVIPECDMPFNKDGIRPDIIVNPHAIPTRMTIGQLVETVTGKSCSLYGGFGDCTAFNNKGSKIGVFGEMLTHAGYHSSGNEILYNGMNGEQINAEIFFGPNYYMRLKHMVKDKINFRSQGPRTAMTRQPVAGRANDGGLRIGEMERDAVISHGASEFLRESMMERSDKYHIAICNNTGMMAIYNPSKKLFLSPMADGPFKFVGSLDGKDMNIENITQFGRNFSLLKVPYSFKLLLQELQTMNIQMRLITEDNIEQLENMSFSKNIDKLLHQTSVMPTSIVYNTRKELLKDKSKPDVYLTPKEESITYPEDVSPAYQATEEELAEMFKKSSNDDSPQYNPYSPVEEENKQFSPHSPTEPPPFEYSPHSPTEPPPFEYSPHSPTEPPPNNELNNLSQQARAFTVGEQVHYRGDSIPGRIWTVEYIGDHFIKIQSPQDGQPPESLLVTALDIYKPGDFTYSSPYAEPLQSISGIYNEEQQSVLPKMLGGRDNSNPTIHFAPNIKIVNGSDFSADTGTGQSTDIPNIPELSQTKIPTAFMKSTDNSPPEEPAEFGSKKIDFNNFRVVKK